MPQAVRYARFAILPRRGNHRSLGGRVRHDAGNFSNHSRKGTNSRRSGVFAFRRRGTLCVESRQIGEQFHTNRRYLVQNPAQTDRIVTYLEGSDFQKSRAYSPAIVTQGGKTVWLAGQTTLVDLEGNSIAHNFEAQARTCFALIDQTLKRVGGTLADLVTMTVSIDDPRHGDHFIRIRHEHFPDGRFPCSALITVSNFAHPGILLEIQAVAVM